MQVRHEIMYFDDDRLSKLCLLSCLSDKLKRYSFWVILAGSWFSNSFPHTSLWRFWSPNVSPQLCEASSVVERAKKTGQNFHLLYNTYLTLASVNATSVTSVNARNNWLQKMVMLVVTNCANFETGASHVNGAMYGMVFLLDNTNKSTNRNF